MSASRIFQSHGDDLKLVHLLHQVEHQKRRRSLALELVLLAMTVRTRVPALGSRSLH